MFSSLGAYNIIIYYFGGGVLSLYYISKIHSWRASVVGARAG